MTGLLSAVLIVRDEQVVLGACLESLRDVADEIVVVDTGSVDRSPQIAESHGARLFHWQWNDDFAEARNVALDHATGEWILYIDADEHLAKTDPRSVHQLLSRAEEIAFRILLRPHRSMTPYLEYRLWRNDPRIRFEGSIHERVVPAIHQVAEAESRPVSDCHLLLLEHIGYEGDQTRKHLRNLPMLTRFVEQHPDHLFAQHHLASVLGGLGRPAEAEEVLWRTVELIRAGDLRDPVGVLAYASLVNSLHGEGRDFEGLLREGLDRYPNNCVLLWVEGRRLVELADYLGALSRFEHILAIGAAGPTLGIPAYDRRLIGEHAHASKGLCLFRLGRYAQAADAYEAAALCAPDDPTYLVRAQVARGRVSHTTRRGMGD